MGEWQLAKWVSCLIPGSRVGYIQRRWALLGFPIKIGTPIKVNGKVFFPSSSGSRDPGRFSCALSSPWNCLNLCYPTSLDDYPAFSFFTWSLPVHLYFIGRNEGVEVLLFSIILILSSSGTPSNPIFRYLRYSPRPLLPWRNPARLGASYALYSTMVQSPSVSFPFPSFTRNESEVCVIGRR